MIDSLKVKLLLEEWKERLGLQDWLIIVRYNCKKSDMDDPEFSIGETQWETTNKCARICIISEKEYGKDRMLGFDFEKTLVHELLHCKFSMIDKDLNTYEGIVAESARHQLIDDLARALVMAKRGETKREINPNVSRIKDLEVESTLGEITISKLQTEYPTVTEVLGDKNEFRYSNI